MHLFIKVTALAALTFSTALGHAKDPGLVIEGGANSKSLRLMIESPALETAVRFHDRLGNIIYSEKTGEVLHYGKKFNLNELEGGLYYLEIEDSFKEIVYTLKVAENFAMILGKEEKVKPVFRKKGHMLFLNLLNLKNANVKIKVLDSDNRLLFKEVVEGDTVVGKAISFEKAHKDKYAVVVSDGQESYYEYVQVE